MLEIDQAPEAAAIVMFLSLDQRGHDATGICLFPLGAEWWRKGVMNIVHPQRPDRFHSVFAGKLAGHPQAVGILSKELGQVVVGERGILGTEDLGHLALVGEEVEALGSRIEDAVDMRAQQRRVPQRQELVDRVSSLGPDVVPVAVEDDAPPAMGSLTAGRIEGVRLDRCDAAVTQPAGSEGSAAGDQAQEEFTTSTLHGSKAAS